MSAIEIDVEAQKHPSAVTLMLVAKAAPIAAYVSEARRRDARRREWMDDVGG